jgi:uncharacterized protein involved in outer membrane biogenesis
MKKYFIGGTVVILLAVAGGSIFLLSNLNSLVARVIEDQGGEATATDVAVSGVDISLREGRAGMSGLTIASPDGFLARKAFSLGEIMVDIDLESLRNDPVVIEEIRIRAPVVAAEFHDDGLSNIGVLKKNVQDHAASFASGNGGGPDNAEKADQKRIRIKRFVFEEGHIEVDASALGLEPMAMDLPSIQLEDIGGPEGALPAEIAQAVLGALTREATSAIARTGLESKVKETVTEEAGKQAKTLLGRITN